jgi:hypothetical protein
LWGRVRIGIHFPISYLDGIKEGGAGGERCMSCVGPEVLETCVTVALE